METSSHGRNIGITIGHFLGPMWSPLMVASSATQVLLPKDTALAEGASWAYTILFLGALACNILFHQGRLCELCARAVPLDPQSVVERDRMWLRLYHSVYTNVFIRVRGHSIPFPLRIFLYMLTLLGIMAAIRFTIDPGEVGSDLTSLFVYSIPIAAVFWSSFRHDRLHLWCPFCRWGRGDDEEVTTPEPDPAASR